MSDWFDRLKVDDIDDGSSVVGDLRPEESIDDWWEDSKRFPYILVCNSRVKYDTTKSSSVINPVQKAKKVIRQILENSGFECGGIQASYYKLGSNGFTKWMDDFEAAGIFDEFTYQEYRAPKNFNGRGFFTEGSHSTDRIYFKIPFWEPASVRQFLRALSSVYHYLNSQLMYNCSWYNQNAASEFPEIFIYSYERKDSGRLTGYPDMIYNISINLLDCMYNKREFRIPNAVNRMDFAHSLYNMKMFKFVYNQSTFAKYKELLYRDVSLVYQLEKDRSLGFKSSPIFTLQL